jgi:hypothetical protein
MDCSDTLLHRVLSALGVGTPVSTDHDDVFWCRATPCAGLKAPDAVRPPRVVDGRAPRL